MKTRMRKWRYWIGAIVVGVALGLCVLARPTDELAAIYALDPKVDEGGGETNYFFKQPPAVVFRALPGKRLTTGPHATTATGGTWTEVELPSGRVASFYVEVPVSFRGLLL